MKPEKTKEHSMKKSFFNSSILRSFVTAIAFSGTFVAASAQAETNLTNRAAIIAQNAGYTLAGKRDAVSGCQNQSEQLTAAQCQSFAGDMNEGFNRGSWGWAPNGCHFNTKHGGIWFNDSSGDTGNRNYTSVCIAQVAEDAGCVGVTSAQNMTESCADELWAEAGCTTSHDHSAWRSWGKTNSLSLQSMKNDFAAWASLKSHGHVVCCQSAI
jgi:hypothetical protein